MIDKSLRQYYNFGKRVKFQGGGFDASQPDFGGFGDSQQGGERDYHHQVDDYTSTPEPTPREERVSPIESMARVGDISLAGKTKTEADNEMAARNREEARDEKIPDRIKNIITPPVIRDEKIPDRIKNIITPPVPKYGDEDIDAVYTDKSFTPKPLVETPKKWYNHPLVRLLVQPLLPEPLQRLLAVKTGITETSDILEETGLTKTNVAQDFMENLEGAFTSKGKPRGTIDTKTERGEGRQIEQPTVQQAISKGEGLESGKKLLGLSEEETNYFKKLFASRDRKFLQSIFDKGTTRMQSGKATQKEQDVYTLLQQYLVDPKTMMAARGGIAGLYG